MIYFLHAPEAKRIKIGKSRSPLARLGTLLAACPFEAHLIGVMEGYTIEEAMMHRRFAEHHAKGEWFHECAEIMLFVSGLPNTVRQMLNRCPEAHSTGARVLTTTECPTCGAGRTHYTCYGGPFPPKKYCSDECATTAIVGTIIHDGGKQLFRSELNQGEQ